MDEVREYNRSQGWRFPDEGDYPEDESLVLAIISARSPKGKRIYYQETPTIVRFWGYDEHGEWDTEDLGKEVNPDTLEVHAWMPIAGWMLKDGGEWD